MVGQIPKREEHWLGDALSPRGARFHPADSSTEVSRKATEDGAGDCCARLWEPAKAESVHWTMAQANSDTLLSRQGLQVPVMPCFADYHPIILYEGRLTHQAMADRQQNTHRTLWEQ